MRKGRVSVCDASGGMRIGVADAWITHPLANVWEYPVHLLIQEKTERMFLAQQRGGCGHVTFHRGYVASQAWWIGAEITLSSIR